MKHNITSIILSPNIPKSPIKDQNIASRANASEITWGEGWGNDMAQAVEDLSWTYMISEYSLNPQHPYKHHIGMVARLEFVT